MVRWIPPVSQNWFHLSLMDNNFHLTYHRCPWCCSGRFKKEIFPSVLSEGTRGRGVWAMWVCPCWCQVTVRRKVAQSSISVGKKMKWRCTPRNSNWCEVPCHALHYSAFGLQDAWGQTLRVLSPVEAWPVFLTLLTALRAGMASGFSRVRVPYPPSSSQRCAGQCHSLACLLWPHGKHSAGNRNRAIACGVGWH